MIHCCSHLTWENVVLLKIHLKGSSASKISHMHINNTHFVVPRVVFNEARWNTPATFSSPPLRYGGSPSVGSVAAAPRREMKVAPWVTLPLTETGRRGRASLGEMSLSSRKIEASGSVSAQEMVTNIHQRVSDGNSFESRTGEGEPKMDMAIFAGGSLLEAAWEFLEPWDDFSPLSCLLLSHCPTGLNGLLIWEQIASVSRAKRKLEFLGTIWCILPIKFALCGAHGSFSTEWLMLGGSAMSIPNEWIFGFAFVRPTQEAGVIFLKD